LAAAIALATVAAPDTVAAEELATVKLIRECKVEAASSHLRHATTRRALILAHKARMKSLCDEWALPAADQVDLLGRCRAEAAVEARHIHRGGNYDRGHMIRQTRLCDDLAAASRQDKSN